MIILLKIEKVKQWTATDEPSPKNEKAILSGKDFSECSLGCKGIIFIFIGHLECTCIGSFEQRIKEKTTFANEDLPAHLSSVAAIKILKSELFPQIRFSRDLEVSELLISNIWLGG